MVQVAEDTPYTEITIQGLTFSVPQPYKEGDALTAGMASSINQTLAENLRNNYAAKIRGKLEDYRKANNIPEETEVGVDVLDKEELDKELQEYAGNYEFGVRQGGGGARVSVDPVTREANDIAWNKIKDALKAKNIKLDTISKEKKAELIGSLLEKNPAILEEAKRRVSTVSELALEGLEIG